MEKSIAKILIIAIISLIGIGFGLGVIAQCNCDPNSPNFGRTPDGRVCICNPLRWQSIQELIEAIVNILLWAGLVVVPLIVIIGIFYITVSAGDPKKITTGKRIIIYALIGLGLILFARGIIGVINIILGFS